MKTDIQLLLAGCLALVACSTGAPAPAKAEKESATDCDRRINALLVNRDQLRERAQTFNAGQRSKGKVPSLSTEAEFQEFLTEAEAVENRLAILRHSCRKNEDAPNQ